MYEEVIFVFGSNLAGRHGKGAALHARKFYGAIYGRGRGFQGKSYAIPTKDENLEVLDLIDIERDIETFINFVKNNPDFAFILTPIGCGLAGYKRSQIRPLIEQFLDGSEDNLIWHDSWKEKDE